MTMVPTVGALGRMLLVLVSLWVLLYALPAYLQVSHYKVLGVDDRASKGDIYVAYERALKSPHSDKDKEKVRHAFYVLSDELRRRDYDNFGLDEAETTQVYERGAVASATTSFTTDNFSSLLDSEKPWLIQVYSEASVKSRDFSYIWERIARTLEDQVNVGRVEAGDQLARVLAERNWATGRLTFRHGLPAIVAFPPGCRDLTCISRYSNELNYDSIIDWVATQVLQLPRIRYYNPQTLGPDFIAKAGRHKVKVIIFSETGERASPYLREAARNYANYASFACVLWLEHEASLWERRLGVESAPAVVFIKDPEVEPVVIHGTMSRIAFSQLMEENKMQVLPQLRSVTAGELGCDLAGHSAAGEKVATWYCVVAAGKPGHKLDQLRSNMRLVQDELESSEDGGEYEPAAVARREKRLTLTWLDGEAQKNFCYYFLSSENVYDTCGPRHYADEEDTPRIFLIRFKRDPVEEEKQLKQQESRNLLEMFSGTTQNYASILVARYNGTHEISNIASWISNTVRDGETQDLPYFRIKSGPALTPEEPTPFLATPRAYAAQAKSKLSERASGLVQIAIDLSKDPKLVTMIIVMLTMYYLGLRKKRASSQ